MQHHSLISKKILTFLWGQNWMFMHQKTCPTPQGENAGVGKSSYHACLANRVSTGPNVPASSLTLGAVK